MEEAEEEHLKIVEDDKIFLALSLVPLLLIWISRELSLQMLEQL